MKQEDAKREILREWRALPEKRRQTQDDATRFAFSVVKKYKFGGTGVPIRPSGHGISGYVIEARPAGLGHTAPALPVLHRCCMPLRRVGPPAKDHLRRDARHGRARRADLLRRLPLQPLNRR